MFSATSKVMEMVYNSRKRKGMAELENQKPRHRTPPPSPPHCERPEKSVDRARGSADVTTNSSGRVSLGVASVPLCVRSEDDIAESTQDGSDDEDQDQAPQRTLKSDEDSSPSTSTAAAEEDDDAGDDNDLSTNRAIEQEDEEEHQEPNGDGSDALQIDAFFGQKLQMKWEEMFRRLQRFREKHGHCLVPNRYSEDPQLGSWVSTQRRHYKILMSNSGESTPMTTERAQKLIDIGFQWSTKDPRHVPWEYRYSELLAFKEKYGHSQVPIGWEDNIQLSNWVSTQRQEYKLIRKGRQSRLTEERVDLLNKIDFIWEAQRGGPRRKRKATVSVPSKPNPVHGEKVRSRLGASRGKLGSMMRGGAHAFASPPASIVGEPAQGGMAMRANIGIPPSALPGTYVRPSQQLSANVQQPRVSENIVMNASNPPVCGHVVMPGFQVAPPQWQLLPNGAFQSHISQNGGMAGTVLFPIVPQLPMITTGFHFAAPMGSVPVVWAHAAPQQVILMGGQPGLKPPENSAEKSPARRSD